MRQFLVDNDFVDVETPTLFRRTPGDGISWCEWKFAQYRDSVAFVRPFSFHWNGLRVKAQGQVYFLSKNSALDHSAIAHPKLSIFIGKTGSGVPSWLTSLGNTFREWGKKMRERRVSHAPGGIWSLGLLIKRRALSRCAATTALHWFSTTFGKALVWLFYEGKFGAG